MSPRPANAGAAIAGLVLLAIPAVDVAFGNAFGVVHAVLGTCGVAFLVGTLRGGEV